MLVKFTLSIVHIIYKYIYILVKFTLSIVIFSTEFYRF